MSIKEPQQKVCVLQSNYIPWKGYFDLIADSDILVIYDDVQFTKNDWRNRNKIKTSAGLLWLTVPVGQNISRNINEVTIEGYSWQKKHWRSLMLSYQKCVGFKSYKDFFEDFYLAKNWTNLSEMNEYLIQNILKFLDIKVNILRSEQFNLEGQKEQRLLDLLKKVEATDYVAGPATLNYISEDNFKQKNIQLHIKQYGPYQPYIQPHGEFCDQVSVLDLLFCCGNEAPLYFKSKNT